MSARKDEDFLQAVAGVAKLGGFTLKGVSTADDFETRTVTVKFTRISDGHVQEAFDWEREPVLAVTANGRGEIETIQGLQPGDLAETEVQANAEIAAAAETLPEAPGGEETDPDDQPRDPSQPLVGELAATARRRR